MQIDNNPLDNSDYQNLNRQIKNLTQTQPLQIDHHPHLADKESNPDYQNQNRLLQIDNNPLDNSDYQNLNRQIKNLTQTQPLQIDHHPHLADKESNPDYQNLNRNRQIDPPHPQPAIEHQ